MAFDLTVFKQKIQANIFPNNERRISAIKLLEVLEALVDSLETIDEEFTTSLYINDLRSNTNEFLKIVFVIDENQFGAFVKASQNIGRPDNGLNVVVDANGNEWLRVQDPYASIGEATEQALALKQDFIPSSSVSNYYAGTKVWLPFPTIPTNNNQLTNGSGFVTSASVNTIVSASINNFSSSVTNPQYNAPVSAGYILSGSIIRKDNTLYNVLDRYTSEYVTYSKVTTHSDGSVMSDGKCDGVIYAKYGSEYFKRNFTGPVNAAWWGITGTNDANDITKLQGIITAGFKDISLPIGTYPTITLNANSVTITGTKPQLSGSTISSGSIFTGRFIISGSYNTIRNIGSTAKTASNDDGIIIRNDASYNKVDNCVFAVGNHAVLVEQYGGTAQGNYISNCKAVGGIHGFVSKSKDLVFEDCIADGQSQDGFVFVSDNITGASLKSQCINNKAINCFATNGNIGFNLYSRDYSSTTNTANIELSDVSIIGGGSDTMVAYGISIGDSQNPGGGQTYNDVKNITVTGGFREKSSGPFGIKYGRCFAVSVDSSCIINGASDKSLTLSKRVKQYDAVKQGSNLGNLVYSTPLELNSTTPTVYYGDRYFETANTSSSVITNFLNGKVGQVITVQIKDAFTTIINSGNITLTNYVKGIGSTVTLKYSSSLIWEEIDNNLQNDRQDWPYTSTYTFDYRNGKIMYTTLTGDATQLNFSNLPNGKEFTLVLQASGATRALSGWDSRIVWLNNKVPRKVTTGNILVYRFYFDGTNIKNIGREGEDLNNSQTFTPGTINAGTQISSSITVTGAEFTDTAHVRFSNDLQGVHLWGYVSAANTVTYVYSNNSASNVTLAEGTVLATVVQH